jgi:two-component system cell cycle response regulator
MSFKILTVDDSRMVRMIVAKTFQPQGCEVYEASNGADGLMTAATIFPDLIFLDITMADQNGLAVLEDMRQVDHLRATPVVMLTAESGNHYIERADKLNVAGYISKPFKSGQLLELASKILKFEPVAAPAP